MYHFPLPSSQYLIINYYYQYLSFIINCRSPSYWQIRSVIPQFTTYYLTSFPLKADVRPFCKGKTEALQYFTEYLK